MSPSNSGLSKAGGALWQPALNADSSSLKCTVFEGEGRRLAGKFSGIGGSPKFKAGDVEEDWPDDAPEALTLKLLDWIERQTGDAVFEAIGHRVVHFGRDFSDPIRVNDDVMDRRDALTPLASFHQPPSLAPTRRFAHERPLLVQIACFDTAFHHARATASRYTLSRKLEKDGIRRYGFHDLSAGR